MKPYLLLGFLLVLLPRLGASQTSWCPPSAEWQYRYSALSFSGTATMRYVRDTIVGGRRGQVLRRSYRSATTTALPTIITRTHGDSVSFWNNGQFVLLYRFGARPGESWTTYAAHASAACPQFPVQLTVDTVGTQNLGGRSWRWLAVHITNGSRSYPWGRVYEGIGGVADFQPTASMCGGTDPDYVGPLQIFRAPGLPTLGTTAGGFSILRVLATAEARARQGGFAAYPNPTNGRVTLQVPPAMQKAGRLALRDLAGRCVRQMAVPTNQEIDVSGLPNGIYLLTVESAGFAPLSQRLAVQ